MRDKQSIQIDYNQKCASLGELQLKKIELDTLHQQLCKEIVALQQEFNDVVKVEQEVEARANAAATVAVNNIPPQNNQ